MIACLEIFLTSLESFCGVGITPQRNVWFVHARSGLNPPVDYLIPLKLLEFFKDNNYCGTCNRIQLPRASLHHKSQMFTIYS